MSHISDIHADAVGKPSTCERTANMMAKHMIQGWHPGVPDKYNFARQQFDESLYVSGMLNNLDLDATILQQAKPIMICIYEGLALYNAASGPEIGHPGRISADFEALPTRIRPRRDPPKYYSSLKL